MKLKVSSLFLQHLRIVMDSVSRMQRLGFAHHYFDPLSSFMPTIDYDANYTPF